MFRSTYSKILAWTLFTLLICVAGLAGTTWTLSRTLRKDDPFARSLQLQLDLLRRAYESGGAAELGRAIQQIDEVFPGGRYFTDSRGRDLLTGEDRSGTYALSREPQGPPGPFPRFIAPGGPIVVSSSDNRYRYIVMPSWRPSPWSMLPYYTWILLAVGLLSYILTRYLVGPVRSLRSSVERFGRGDLAARTGATRRDEFGDVSRAFDQMADRIQTLLTAERRLLQDISHELRTPLSRLGFAIELARTAPDREASLARIRKEADRLSALVGQLLQVTRAEGDPATRDLSPVPVNDLLKEVADDAAWEAELRHVKIVTRLDEPVVVRGDRELLRRAVENIVRNAVRYAPESSAVEIGLVRSSENAVIRVRDQGPGVQDQHLGEIFKPFFREDSSRNGATGGMGLGLAIAHRAIHLHHGTVAARNARPGLEVEIALPVGA